MKASSMVAIVASIGVMASVSVLAADHKIPTAPKDYLDMKNPLADSKDALDRGQKIFEKKCTKCHGEKGDGKGSSAAKLETKPTAFNAPGYLKGRADGQLLFIVDKGSPNTDMDDFGPGSDTKLSKDDMWSVITYMRKTFSR